MQKSLQRFLQAETLSGILMLLAAICALCMANIPFLMPLYESLKHFPMGLSLGTWGLTFTVEYAVREGLMIIFFLVVGLELKREMYEGGLSQKGQKILPFVAAVGGALCPALLYLALTWGAGDMAHGWGVPTATDIAFALTVLLFVKKYIPTSARLFLMAVAVFDDLIAILIIALFYSSHFSLMGVGISAALVGILALLNKGGVVRLWPYLTLGAVLAVALHMGGLHTTLAGVITAFAIPLRSPHNPSHAPVSVLLSKLHGVTAYWIVPLFAFVSAGVLLPSGAELGGESLRIMVAVFLALVLGKQMGIWGATWLSVRFKLASLPEGMKWRDVYTVSCLAGVGFTMSLFVAALAFPTHKDLLSGSVLGILLGSVVASIWGMAVAMTKPLSGK